MWCHAYWCVLPVCTIPASQAVHEQPAHSQRGRRTDISRERGLKEKEKDTLCYQGYAEKGDIDGDATLSEWHPVNQRGF